MDSIAHDRMAELLRPFAGEALPAELLDQLGVYLALLLRWNARTNLTAITEPEDIVRRHFGESLFAARQMESRLQDGASVLDFGAGAGFPGLPLQLLHPKWRVTLAESQGKKASFLREVVRTLGLETEVWGGRVEWLSPPRQFECVAMRAVDKMESALAEATRRVAPGGWLLLLAGDTSASLGSWENVRAQMPGAIATSCTIYSQRA